MDSAELLSRLAKRYEELGHWVEVDGNWLNRWTAAVVIGVAFELWVIWRDHASEWQDFRRGTIRSPERPNRPKLIMELLSTLLVIVGVAGEFFIARSTGEKDTEMRAISGKQVSIAEGDAAAANKEAGEAKQRAVELEAQIQPRYLTDKQRESITTQMRPFSSAGFLIASYWLDPEGARLAKQIRSVLSEVGMGRDDSRLAGGTVDLIGMYPEITYTLLTGVAPASVPRLGVEVWGNKPEAVRVLSEALGSVSAQRLDKPPPGFERFENVMPVAVFVGLKPIPGTR